MKTLTKAWFVLWGGKFMVWVLNNARAPGKNLQ